MQTSQINFVTIKVPTYITFRRQNSLYFAYLCVIQHIRCASIRARTFFLPGASQLLDVQAGPYPFQVN